MAKQLDMEDVPTRYHVVSHRLLRPTERVEAKPCMQSRSKVFRSQALSAEQINSFR